ncbi:MAG: response regulator transcription factor [Cyanobacteria bacterium]|nr:response regulator transcription factor [Cyanobacteriota bacterium]
MPKMLIGETQKDLVTAMKDFFSSDHYTVQIEDSGLRILECLRQNQYDVIVLEIALIGLDGISVVRGYRAAGGSAPILLLAGAHSSDELQRGLDAGADSYLVKPFRLNDLAALLRALLRRPALRNERVHMLHGIALDSESGTVTRNDIPIHLRPLEFKLLQFLMRHPNQIFSTHALFHRVWQKDSGMMEDTVRTHIRTLRQKIDLEGCRSFITTVRGIGYMVCDRPGASHNQSSDLIVVNSATSGLPMQPIRRPTAPNSGLMISHSVFQAFPTESIA